MNLTTTITAIVLNFYLCLDQYISSSTGLSTEHTSCWAFPWNIPRALCFQLRHAGVREHLLRGVVWPFFHRQKDFFFAIILMVVILTLKTRNFMVEARNMKEHPHQPI